MRSCRLGEVVPPFHLEATVRVLQRRPGNRVDAFEQGRYRRVLETRQGLAWVEVENRGTIDAPDLRYCLRRPAALSRSARAGLVRTLRRVLGLDVDPRPLLLLARIEPRLDPVARALRGMRPPRFTGLFEAFVNVVPFQQLSLDAGVAIVGRLVERFGNSLEHDGRRLHAFPTAQTIAEARLERLRQCGLSRRKGEVLRRLAQAIVCGELREEALCRMRTPDALRTLTALPGIEFAITSGRPPRGMAMLIAPLGLRTPIAAFNGGLFVMPDMTIVQAHVLPADVARRTVEIILGNAMDVWVYSGQSWLVRDAQAPHVAREQWTVKFAPTVVARFGSALDRASKIVGVSDDLERVARCERQAQHLLGAAASAARSQPYYLDVTHPDANKGTVIAMLSKYLSIPRREIASIGDMPNDVPMFRSSALSIAMGNASAQVRAQADHATDSCEDEGFAKAMERFILQPRTGMGAAAMKPARDNHGA